MIRRVESHCQPSPDQPSSTASPALPCPASPSSSHRRCRTTRACAVAEPCGVNQVLVVALAVEPHKVVALAHRPALFDVNEPGVANVQLDAKC